MRRWVELAAAMDRNGIRRSEIARIFGVTPAAVTQSLMSYVEPPDAPEWVSPVIAGDYRRIASELGERNAMLWAFYWMSKQ